MNANDQKNAKSKIIKQELKKSTTPKNKPNKSKDSIELSQEMKSIKAWNDLLDKQNKS